MRDYVADVEERYACGPHSISHAQVALHTGETGVGEVDTIQVAALGYQIPFHSHPEHTTIDDKGSPHKKHHGNAWKKPPV